LNCNESLTRSRRRFEFNSLALRPIADYRSWARSKSRRSICLTRSLPPRN
jgi:hypothetical protein